MRGLSFQIILHLVAILVFGYLGIYILTSTYFWLVSIWVFLLVVILIYSLIRRINRHKRDLQNFLISIGQNDFTNRYSNTKVNGVDQELEYAYNTIIDRYQELRQEKESNFQFLKAVTEQATVPLLGYKTASGDITLLNEAAKKLFDKPYMKNIKTLKQVDSTLSETVEKLQSGERELLKMVLNGELHYLSVQAKELILQNEDFKLVSLQDIRTELDEKEVESWQKLIRILTHEIKNSAIPISTLTEVINQLLVDENGELKDLSNLHDEDLDDLKVGLRTIEKRSKGLVHFVNAYGELARVPQPRLETINLLDLVNDVVGLLKSDFKKADIQMVIDVESVSILLDQDLIEQVLINLLKNAREALSKTDNPQITVRSISLNDTVRIEVTDNGPGIPPDVLENIFVPFFTTKQKGSGIGLSLSKQIMRAHKGDLSVKSTPGEGATFALSF